MKKLITCILVLFSLLAYAQPDNNNTKNDLYLARQMANPKSKLYQPTAAFDLYMKQAKLGNSEAMNALGILYSNGIGTEENPKEAMNWYQKSAKLGYAKAFYNLGLMYKDGIYVQQDFEQAFKYFGRGAKLNNKDCIYGKGYLLYKGLGCNQDYTQAVEMFKRGVVLRNEGSIYMLGLCYRNGYGTPVNLDSARYMLRWAAQWGDERAKQELADSTPENLNIQVAQDLQPAASKSSKPNNPKNGYRRISHHLPVEDITGEYAGFAVKYDWSGKHVIGQSDLKLNLIYKDKKLTGEWIENDEVEVSLDGELADSTVLFNNTKYEQTDHYHKNKPLLVEFKTSRLQIVKSADTVYLTGNINLYSPQSKEPEKPEFIMLIRTNNKQTLPTANNDISAPDSLHFVAFPNPFTGPLKLRYTLKNACRVSIMVSDLLNGSIVYRSNPVQLGEGEHTDVIEFNGHPGNYVVTLQYGGRIKSAIIFKQ